MARIRSLIRAAVGRGCVRQQADNVRVGSPARQKVLFCETNLNRAKLPIRKMLRFRPYRAVSPLIASERMRRGNKRLMSRTSIGQRPTTQSVLSGWTPAMGGTPNCRPCGRILHRGLCNMQANLLISCFWRWNGLRTESFALVSPVFWLWRGEYRYGRGRRCGG